MVLPYLIALVVIISLIVLNNKRKQKVWRRRIRQLPDSERNLPYKKQKKAWKKHIKDERFRRKADRKERVKRLEEEDAEAGFSLFKKRETGKDGKDRRSSRSKKSPMEVVEVDISKDKAPPIEDLSELEL
jgi:hypothetical protein